MTFNPSNPIWTAYLAGELTDDERADVERQLGSSPAARALVADLRRTIEALASELAAEPTPTGAADPLAISAAVTNAAAKSRRRWRQGLVAVAIAASLFVAALLLPTVQQARESGRVAQSDNSAQLPNAGTDSMLRNLSVAETTHESPSGASTIHVSSPGSVDQFNPSRTVRLEAPDPTNPFPDFSSGLDIPFRQGAGTLDIDGSLPQESVEGRKRSEYSLELLAKGNDAANFGRSGSELDLAVPDLRAPEHSLGRTFDAVNESRISRDGGSGTYNQTGGSLSGGDFTVGGQDGTGSHSGQRRVPTITGKLGPTAGKLDVNEDGINGDPGSVLTTTAGNSLNLRNGTIGDADLQGQNGGAVRLGRETQSLTTMVTPRIVIQEEEEERLGGRLAPGTESYEPVTDNPFRAVFQEPLSTFSIDVDTASFANVRRFIVQNHRLPPAAAVRIEELVNYFHYDYPRPEGDVPFSVHTEVAGCLWNAGHRLVKIGLKGREIARENRPASNLVFLVDVSGSMNEPNKLPLVKDALKLLVGQLTENDRVAMVVYAGTSGLVLPSTNGSKPAEIRAAIDRLEAGGSTNGGAGIQLAYETALQNFIAKGNNRVILATDGDFNVGITNRDELVKFVAAQAKSGVYLTTLGFGFGNLKDNMLEQLADKGNGNYAYIDDLREAHKVLVEEMSGTLVAIAKDVKIQIEFNPAAVAAFRLVGYENRILAHKDFNDDSKDAGEIGAGHTVTALYEIVPVGGDGAGGAGADEPRTGQAAPAVDPLKYQRTVALTDDARTGDLLTVNLRYKDPDATESKKLTHSVKDAGRQYGQASTDYKFASAVASFGMILRNSPHRGTGTLAGVIELAEDGRGSDHDGRRAEFILLVRKALELAK